MVAGGDGVPEAGALEGSVEGMPFEAEELHLNGRAQLGSAALGRALPADPWPELLPAPTPPERQPHWPRQLPRCSALVSFLIQNQPRILWYAFATT